jgi:hypothetical protein
MAGISCYHKKQNWLKDETLQLTTIPRLYFLLKSNYIQHFAELLPHIFEMRAFGKTRFMEQGDASLIVA